MDYIMAFQKKTVSAFGDVSLSDMMIPELEVMGNFSRIWLDFLIGTFGGNFVSSFVEAHGNELFLFIEN